MSDDNEIDGGWKENPLEWSWHLWGQDDSGNQVTVVGTGNSGIEMEAANIHTRNNYLHNNSVSGIAMIGAYQVTLEGDLLSNNGFRGAGIEDIDSPANLLLLNVKSQQNNQQYTAVNSQGRPNDHTYATSVCYSFGSGSFTQQTNPSYCLLDGNQGSSDRYWGVWMWNVTNGVCIQDTGNLLLGNRPYAPYESAYNTDLRQHGIDPAGGSASPAYSTSSPNPCSAVNPFAPPPVGVMVMR